MTPTPPNTELADCPFCGGKADTWIENEDDPDTECATCPNPDCVGSQVRTAVEHWNTRHLATLREDKGGEEWIKAQPHETYEGLRQQFHSLKSLVNSMGEQLSFYHKKSYETGEKHLKDLQESLESERDMNAKLTEELAALKNPSDAGGE